EKLESRLQQARKMEAIGTLAGGIAHDFNNILFPIIGFTELSIQELHETHPVAHNLQDILQGAKRARDLVNQILTFSRQKKVKAEVLTFQPLIKESLRLLRATIPSSIEIHQDLEQTPISIFGNPTEVQEIIMNLCTNAYHAMNEGGGILKLCFKRADSAPEPGRPPGEYCCLSISDTGSGIPADVIDKIFDPYFTTKDQGKGTGLGLSIVHSIVQTYNGYIKVQSNAGSGTVFDVYLPVIDRETPGKAVAGKKVLPTGQEKILLVDDETAIVKMVTRFLKKFGYEVTGLSSSVEAAQVFEADPSRFDLVITDMTMPEMTGAELAEKLLGIRPDLPIIICSGYSENVNRETIGKLGIKDYLDKPLLIDELSVKIRAVLDRATH
ncbi:MAG: response regulator, partial [Desulfobacterales bacterium]|nr:response regulator [Desulfobacterales bacterium]